MINPSTSLRPSLADSPHGTVSQSPATSPPPPPPPTTNPTNTPTATIDQLSIYKKLILALPLELQTVILAYSTVYIPKTNWTNFIDVFLFINPNPGISIGPNCSYTIQLTDTIELYYYDSLEKVITDYQSSINEQSSVLFFITPTSYYNDNSYSNENENANPNSNYHDFKFHHFQFKYLGINIARFSSVNNAKWPCICSELQDPEEVVVYYPTKSNPMTTAAAANAIGGPLDEVATIVNVLQQAGTFYWDVLKTSNTYGQDMSWLYCKVTRIKGLPFERLAELMQLNTISRFVSLKEVNVSVSEPITNFMFLQLLYEHVSVLSIDLVGLVDTVFNTDLQEFLRFNDQVLFSTNWLITSMLPLWCSFDNERSSDLHLFGDTATTSDVQLTIDESTVGLAGLETGDDVSTPTTAPFSISGLHNLQSLTFAPPSLSQFENLVFENPTMRNFTISHIEHIRNTSFANLPSLKELWLDSPKYLTIDQFSFNTLPCSSLRVLQLKHLEVSSTTQLRSFVVPKYIRSFRFGD
ncbi:unnamed protein product [Ambrosiozyma monospora]|uniref:Unnamed protein product n=1 Tax=Ambrosiozyma monospora TaxID=43982 RepID=A0A9W6Z327_AMBMO|nr:unnamed protein product [Ambrosiozyma monospora]